MYIDVFVVDDKLVTFTHATSSPVALVYLSISCGNLSVNDPVDQLTRRGQNRMVPLGSTLNDVFSGGASVWVKIAAGAIATPLIVAGTSLRSSRRGEVAIPNDPLANLTIPFDFKVKGKKKRYILQQHSF